MHVWLIFAKLQEAGLHMELSECTFEMQPISFLKFIVMLEGVKIESDRVYMIMKWTEPTCHCNIQVCLGFANFY